MTPQSQVLQRELLAEVRDWRAGLQDIFASLSRHPEAADVAELQSRLDGMLARLERQIGKALSAADQAGVSTPEHENSFRLLGAFRGVSGGVVGWGKGAGRMDGARLGGGRL